MDPNGANNFEMAAKTRMTTKWLWTTLTMESEDKVIEFRAFQYQRSSESPTNHK